MKNVNKPESRRSGKAKASKDPTESKEKFPEMARKVLRNSEIILEVINSQFVKETKNPTLEKEAKKKGKTLIYVFNKSDLSKRSNLAKFSYLQPNVWVSCKERSGISSLRDLVIKKSKKIEREDNEKVTVGIIGYPNTGKSSLINQLAKKSSAKTSSEAGYTKGLQKIKLNKDIVLLDSPGVISKASYSGTETNKITQHAKVGSRSYSQVKEADMVVATIMKEYPGKLESHYEIDAKGDPEELIERLGEKRGYMKSGGKVDEERTAKHILKDWQEGEIEI